MTARTCGRDLVANPALVAPMEVIAPLLEEQRGSWSSGLGVSR
ncbi:hypothetical protein [Actinospongicola halichondriae]